MTDPRLIDFDSFRAEQAAAPFLFRVGGHTYELPNSPPADAALEIIRLKDLGEEKLPPETVFRLATAVFGQAIVDAFVKVERFSVVELGKAIERYMVAVNQTMAPPPNRKTRRARKSLSPST